MLRELMHRTSTDVDVTLFFEDDRNAVVIALVDFETKLQALFVVDPDKAMDSFHHPYPALFRAEEVAIAV